MNGLVDEVVQAPAVIFDEMMAELALPDEDAYRTWGDVFAFDWQTHWAEASAPVEPWVWEWRTPLRGLLSQLSGRSDVTTWTLEAAKELDSLLKDSSTDTGSLLGLEFETEQPPAVAPPAVSAEGD